MTVKELIDELEKVKNKDAAIKIWLTVEETYQYHNVIVLENIKRISINEIDATNLNFYNTNLT